MPGAECCMVSEYRQRVYHITVNGIILTHNSLHVQKPSLVSYFAINRRLLAFARVLLNFLTTHGQEVLKNDARTSSCYRQKALKSSVDADATTLRLSR
jgi:hypothetical protein